MMNGRSNQMDMLHGPLLGKILMFAMPLAISTILQQLFNSADIAVVGRFDSSQAMAAVGSNGAAINLLVNLFVGLSIGANVVAAAAIGQNEPRKIRDAVHTSIALALLSGVILLGSGQLMARWLLEFMDTPPDVMELAVLYLRLYFLGTPFIMLYNFGSALLRSRGDSQRPLWCLTVSGVLNVVLNLIFVIAFRMGVAGVAVATVLSNAVSAWMVMRYLAGEEEPFRFEWRRLALRREALLQMLRVGAPAGVQGMLFSISNVCIQAAINGFGSAGSAGSAAAIGFDFITFCIVNAFTQAAVTFVSQNYGAGQLGRCRLALRLSFGASLAVTGLACAACFVWRRWLLSFYTLDPVVLAFGEVRMIHAVSFIWMCGIYEIPGGAMRGMGHSLLPTVFVLLGCCALRLAWIYAFRLWPAADPLTGFAHLMDIYPISWTVTSVATLIAWRQIWKKAVAGRPGPLY